MANPTLLEMPIARDGAKNSIPSTTSPTTGLLSQQYGWQDINSMPVQQGGKAPSRLDFNGVLNLLSNILFYCQKGWQFEWDSSQAYYAGCIIKDTSDGKMYMCLNDVTSTTAPHSDSTNWELWDLSMLGNYLPLSGGNMTGGIGSPNKTSIKTIQADIVGSGIGGGARIELYGSEVYTGADDYANGRAILYASGKDTNEPSQNLYAGLELRRNGGLFIQKFINDTLQYSYDISNSAVVAKSLGVTSGYVKQESGEIRQYGDTMAISANDNIQVTFPLSYSGATTYGLSIVPANENGTAPSAPFRYEIYNVTATGFMLWAFDALPYGIKWLAIGY